MLHTDEIILLGAIAFMYGVYTPYIFVSYGLTCAGCCLLLGYAVAKRRAARAALADIKQRNATA